MREIKFRGYATKRSQFTGYFTGLCGPIYDPAGNPSLHDGMSWIEVEKESIGQYIGLKDVNNVDIYEGDIVKLQNKKLGVISYDDFNSMFRLDEIGEDFLYHISCAKEVVGNIYENPELLNK